jgi:hypothetical protein
MEIHGNTYAPFVPPGATREARTIRIIDGRYNPIFTIQDGEWLTVDDKAYQVRYIDETHFQIDGQYFHICQFGENVVDQGRIVKKMTRPMTDDEYAVARDEADDALCPYCGNTNIFTAKPLDWDESHKTTGMAKASFSCGACKRGWTEMLRVVAYEHEGE